MSGTMVAIGLGFVAGPLAIPILIGAFWGCRWSLWAIGSLLLLWGAFAWGLGVAQFAAIDSPKEAEDTLIGAMTGGVVIVLVSTAVVAWRSRRRGIAV